MFSLLDPKLWGAALIGGALLFGAGFWKGNTHGTKTVRAEWLEATAAANQEARRLEQARQRRADEAAQLGAGRAKRLAADARSARSELDRLRSAVSATKPASEESCTAASQRADTLGKLLLQSGELLTEIAGSADRHASDVKLLLDAWPH